jgi:hypothetical protein
MLCQGFSIALKKPLWNDEIYTQISIENTTWAVIFMGRIIEGNNSPVFYSIQKIICVALGYRSNDLWHNDDVSTRFISRIAPVFCMSLGLALIVWFFCIHYSLLGGLIAFIISITSYMVWYYWAEARPYALIFLATTIQTLALLYFYRLDHKSRYWGVGVANLFLAFISSLSVIQIMASGVVLWFKGCRRIWPLLWGVGLPLGIAFGYYVVADHCFFYFAPHGQPLSLICANIPAERIGAFFIFPVLIWLLDRYVNKKKEFALWPFFVWAWLIFIGYVLFIAYFLFIKHSSVGFEISNRYFMTLTPVGMIVVSAGMLELVKRPHSIWGRVIVWVAILAVILPRLVKAFRWMNSL